MESHRSKSQHPHWQRASSATPIGLVGARRPILHVKILDYAFKYSTLSSSRSLDDRQREFGRLINAAHRQWWNSAFRGALSLFAYRFSLREQVISKKLFRVVLLRREMWKMRPSPPEDRALVLWISFAVLRQNLDEGYVVYVEQVTQNVIILLRNIVINCCMYLKKNCVKDDREF